MPWADAHLRYGSPGPGQSADTGTALPVPRSAPCSDPPGPEMAREGWVCGERPERSSGCLKVGYLIFDDDRGEPVALMHKRCLENAKRMRSITEYYYTVSLRVQYRQQAEPIRTVLVVSVRGELCTVLHGPDSGI
ncbi:hypothetical protein NDU88_004566 [Pleurodeles waltl]|uniref:Uncharacterized protein n=1 Tax=Pleurodeles waltl TaxID=8319 RepID=A0AAV7WWY8_PLEWA|nr:hypothetical protein NDU88_004566 [Pleurodeles waltl]